MLKDKWDTANKILTSAQIWIKRQIGFKLPKSSKYCGTTCKL